LPDVDPQELHALGDAIGGYEPARLASFVDAVNEWLANSLKAQGADARRMARIADAWDKVNQAASDIDEYNLERKPFVFSVFGWLAEAARP
jgi:DNA polymerase-3 subunit delta'